MVAVFCVVAVGAGGTGAVVVCVAVAGGTGTGGGFINMANQNEGNETLVTVQANVRYLNGVETIKGGAETATGKASIRIAYRTNVTTAMRAYLGSTEFRITAVLPDEVNKMHTDLTVEVIA